MGKILVFGLILASFGVLAYKVSSLHREPERQVVSNKAAFMCGFEYGWLRSTQGNLNLDPRNPKDMVYLKRMVDETYRSARPHMHEHEGGKP